MSNKKIIVGSIIVGVATVLFIVGSLWLVRKPAASRTSATEKTPPPTPEVVTVQQLSPDELTRLVLQLWYARDFNTLYTLLDPSLQVTEPREIFIQRMQSVPVISGVSVSNLRREDAGTEYVTLTIRIDARVIDKTLGSDMRFQFKNTNGEWKITALPDFASLYKK